MKILIADDSRVMRQIVIRTLRQAGYDDHDIVEAEDGADALAKVGSESPDLILSDWNMPNMIGIEPWARSACRHSIPVMFGMFQSESTRSGFSDPTLASASAPSSASTMSWSSKPAWRRVRMTTAASCGRS